MRALLLAASIAALLIPALQASSCTHCHENATLMEGYEEYIVTLEEVWNQSRMFRQGLGGPQCEDCHLGNASSYTKEGAHAGMLSLIVVSRERALLRLNRSYYPEIGVFAPGSLALRIINDPYLVKTVLYHDRSTGNYAFNSTIANMTCGRCHPREVEDYLTSSMGGARMQSAYPGFTYPAPHNCGYWLVNLSTIRSELAVPYSAAQAELNDRVCRQCHTSCLDCHYQPDRGKGRHFFSRSVEASTCYFGGGRGICHVGAEEYRRGAGYFREEVFGLADDVHAELNLSCLECHTYQDHNITRSATCGDCHLREEGELAESVHANLTCEACHVSSLAGYQATFWAPGEYYGMQTPLAKINYYGIMDVPVLIRDMQGRWIPVKPMPQAVLNMRKSLSPTGLRFRTLPGLRNTSSDAFAVAGTFPLPEYGNAIAWVHMDKVSHGFGRGRECEECHSGEQRSHAEWSYEGEHMPEPVYFYGESLVVANSTGMFIILKNTTDVPLAGAAQYAPWIYGVRWRIEGDFSISAKSDACGEGSCSRCHGDAHGTIKPLYMKNRGVLLAVALVLLGALLVVAAAAYLSRKKRKLKYQEK
ncbi:MAG: hypothetical protein GXO66_04145 [Euryarchaeota archaeon]|nr:hypothetical protein [Euryarchaeota archaeon]